MMPISDAQKEALARVDSNIQQLNTLEFRHPAFGGAVRFVAFDQDIEAEIEANAPVDGGQLVNFIGRAMSIREPDIDSEVDTTITAQIDGLPGDLQPIFAAAVATPLPIESTFRVVPYNVKTGEVLGISSPIHFQIRNIKNTLLSTTVTLGYRNSARQSFPNDLYTSESNPSLAL